MLLGKVSTGDKYSPPLSTELNACCCCCNARSRGLSFIPGGAMNFEYGFPGADGIRFPATCFGVLAGWYAKLPVHKKEEIQLLRGV